MLNRVRFGRSGNVSVIIAIILPALLMMAGFGLEYGNALLTKSDIQRIADTAAFAAANAYASGSSAATINATLARVGATRGLPSTALTYNAGDSPRNNGNKAVQVTVTTTVPLYLSRVLGTRSSVTVVAAASAEVSANGPGCIWALSHTGTGITQSGSTAITAPNCIIASNNTVTVPCASTMTSLAVVYNSTNSPSQPCGGIKNPQGGAGLLVKKPVIDPLAGNATVAALRARVATVAALASPTAPTAPTATGSVSITFGNNPSQAATKATQYGCTATFFSATSTYTFTCPANLAIQINQMNVSSGYKVLFNTSGNGSNTYTFKTSVDATGVTWGKGTYNIVGDLTASGSALITFADANINVSGDLTSSGSGGITFGNGNVSVTGGIINNGSGTMTFGAGTLWIGRNSSKCQNSYYSLCSSNGPITFVGSSTIPSTFKFSSGIAVGGKTILFATSTANNSYQLGKSADGYSINAAGSSNVQFGDVRSGGVFESPGTILFDGGSSACLAFPAAAQHDINSSLDTAGGVIMGSGIYTFNGYVAFGRINGNGTKGNCNGTAVSVKGNNITLVISGSTTPGSGQCSGYAYCMVSGYADADMSAPTSADGNRLLVVGPPTTGTGATTYGANFGQGNSAISMSGTFYFPNGAIDVGGGAGLGDKVGQCLTLIGSQVSLNGNSMVSSQCVGGTVNAQLVTLIR